MSYETIIVEKDSQANTGVTLITLNHQSPERSKLDSSGRAHRCIYSHQADNSHLARFLRAVAKTFAAGADIKEMHEKAAADFYLDDFFSPGRRDSQENTQTLDRCCKWLCLGRWL